MLLGTVCNLMKQPCKSEGYPIIEEETITGVLSIEDYLECHLSNGVRHSLTSATDIQSEYSNDSLVQKFRFVKNVRSPNRLNVELKKLLNQRKLLCIADNRFLCGDTKKIKLSSY